MRTYHFHDRQVDLLIITLQETIPVWRTLMHDLEDLDPIKLSAEDHIELRNTKNKIRDGEALLMQLEEGMNPGAAYRALANTPEALEDRRS